MRVIPKIYFEQGKLSDRDMVGTDHSDSFPVSPGSVAQSRCLWTIWYPDIVMIMNFKCVLVLIKNIEYAF